MYHYPRTTTPSTTHKSTGPLEKLCTAQKSGQGCHHWASKRGCLKCNRVLSRGGAAARLGVYYRLKPDLSHVQRYTHTHFRIGMLEFSHPSNTLLSHASARIRTQYRAHQHSTQSRLDTERTSFIISQQAWLKETVSLPSVSSCCSCRRWPSVAGEGLWDRERPASPSLRPDFVPPPSFIQILIFWKCNLNAMLSVRPASAGRSGNRQQVRSGRTVCVYLRVRVETRAGGRAGLSK